MAEEEEFEPLVPFWGSVVSNAAYSQPPKHSAREAQSG
jgi:hypothetical protein